MPFEKAFDDIYKFGIKGAATEVGAYAERVDEQMFTEGILERIFNQINKTDVVVADMSGRNPNVFYEVGYAHALGKLVLLLTQKAEDIPFDLKHHQHTVYEGKIDLLRSELVSRLAWAIEEGRQRKTPAEAVRLEVSVLGRLLADAAQGDLPDIQLQPLAARSFQLPVSVRNVSLVTAPPLSHVYLFVPVASTLRPIRERPTSSYAFTIWVDGSVPNDLTPVYTLALDGADCEQYRLPESLPAMPAGAVEVLPLNLRIVDSATVGTGLLRLRLQSEAGTYDYRLRLSASVDEEKLKQSEARAREAQARHDGLSAMTFSIAKDADPGQT